MFFILSKVLYYAIMPLTIICVLLGASAFVRRQPLKKKLFVSGVGLLLFFSNDFIANEVMMLWEIPVTPFKDLTKKYEWGIILTGVTKEDAGPADRVYFTGGADRVTHAVQLYKSGIVKKLLVSGGSGRLDMPDRKEAMEIASALQLMGVPENDIVTESKSRNTHESAIAVKEMLQNQTTSSECILITSAFHMRRSLLCFQKVRWKVDPFSGDIHSHKRNFMFDTLFIPKIEAIGIWHTLTKEFTGMLAYKLAGYI